MRRRLLIVQLVMASTFGCGARTDLDVSQPDAQAPDASFFVTFPCRWTLGRSIELARGEAFDELTGAVHATAERVLVAASERGRERRATLLTLTARPEIRRTLEPFGEGALWTGVDAFVQQSGDGCEVAALDETLAPGPSLRWGDARCELTQMRAGWVHGVAIGEAADGAVHEVGPLFAPSLSAEPVGAADPTAERAEVVADRDADVAFVISQRAARLTAARSGPDGTSSATLIDEPGAEIVFSSAPDRLRGGALVLIRSTPSEWRLVRVASEGELAPTDLVDLAELPAAPTGQLVTNETEALMPLVDGTLAYVPLARSHVRHLPDPLHGAPVEAVRVILRPDESAGGVLYVTRERREAVLRYQPLTCNR